MATRDIVQSYVAALSAKRGWENLLAEELGFTSPIKREICEQPRQWHRRSFPRYRDHGPQ